MAPTAIAGAGVCFGLRLMAIGTAGWIIAGRWKAKREGPTRIMKAQLPGSDRGVMGKSRPRERCSNVRLAPRFAMNPAEPAEVDLFTEYVGRPHLAEGQRC